MRSRRLANVPATPLERVQELQTSLQAKAKAEPDFWFYSLWDKLCRADVLEEAYRACRRNDPAHGRAIWSNVDPIAARCTIDGRKSCGRSCGPATIGHSPCCAYGYQKATAARARLAFRASATAWSRWRCLLVLGPIFEADLLRNQYGFRPGMDAKMAVRQAFGHVSDDGRTEVVDADLSDYYSSIPHGPLMRCVSRHVANGTLLSVIKRWLTAPVTRHDPMHNGEGPTSGDPARLPDLAPTGESLLPPLPAGLGAVRSPKTGRRPRRQLCRRSRHLLPTGKRIGGTGDADPAPDDTARADGERDQDAIGATARGEL